MLDENKKAIIAVKILKNKLHLNQSINLGILAGMFISIGALLMSIAKEEGCNKIVCGIMFSSGLFFVVVTGAELFTGNCMIRGLLSGETDATNKAYSPTKLLLTNYISNFIGAMAMFALVVACNFDYSTLTDIAVSKCNQSELVIFAKGLACNILVCLAVWISVYIEPTCSKIERFIAVLFPITAFVACGFEHSIANMFFLPFGILAGKISILQAFIQLVFTTIGNWLGGFILGVLFSETMIEE